MPDTSQKISWLDRPIFTIFPQLTGEMVVFLLIIFLACISRLYELGARVMSHDENLHVYFSWLFSMGKGYQHTPLMHGPLQFHFLALAYQLFGASDFTARLPHAISSILAIGLLWKWRRYLGRAGTLVAAGLMLISPFMLYYGRYARNEAFISVLFVLTLYAILRYLETGKSRYLILLTISTALHFTVKETAFIYTAQAMLFLAVYLLNRVTRTKWKKPSLPSLSAISLTVGIVLAGAALGLAIFQRIQVTTDASQTSAPIIPGIIPGVSTAPTGWFHPISLIIILACIMFLLSVILLIIGYGWKNLCDQRAFDMLVLLVMFVLPQMAAFPVTALGWNPLEYQFTWPGWNPSALWAQAPVRTGAVFLALCLVSIVLGALWNKQRWFVYAATFWGIYIFFYTSIFSNWRGFFTGTVGSLGYWLQQQDVHRGGQPWYYFLLIQIPVYEFLPAFGVLLAAYFGLRRRSPIPALPSEKANTGRKSELEVSQDLERPLHTNPLPASKGKDTFLLLFWWTLSSLVAFTLAGEKMPWLTVHLTLPMIMLAGWGIGQLIERLNWQVFRQQRGGAITILLIILLISLAGILVNILGANPPFQGKSQVQLAASNAFLFKIGILVTCIVSLYFMFKGWKFNDGLKVAVICTFTLLAVLTGRAAIRAVYIHPNDATEYLVYAHGAEGIQDVMDQVNRISGRIYGEKNIPIAYDSNLPNQGVSWSFKWYLRNYPSTVSFDKPENSLRDYPVIIVDQQNFENIKPVVSNNYYRLEYIRMVWPNQDYFGLTWSRILTAITNKSLRDAIFQVWLNRDYSEYSKVTGKSGLSLSDWQPSSKMQLFIRKDIAAQMWEYGISQSTPLQADPYEKGMVALSADLVIGPTIHTNSQLSAPRGLTVAPDGSAYAADSGNNRIVHFDAMGNVLQIIGEASPGCPYDTVPPENVSLGTFCEPWALAVSPNGQWIYVADTWNHRIQKLSSDGTPVKTWGIPNYDPVSSSPFGLWGPRGIAVDSLGHVLVSDTGNKRIVIYDSDGNFIFQFGGGGVGAGQFDEPVGLAFDEQGNLYVADTWNQRIQVFVSNTDKTSYTSSIQWDIAGWSSQSLDNKPFLAVDQRGHLFTTDPDSFRVLEFTYSGTFLRGWGEYGTSLQSFGLPSGISIDNQGRVWVSDSANNRLMRFTLP